MSTTATFFSIYFGIGLVLMIVAFISRKAERPAKKPGLFFDEHLLVFVALAWPIWLFTSLLRDDDESPRR